MAAIKSTTRSKYETIEVGAVEVLADISLLVKADSLYFNATLIAKQFGKDIQVFIRMDETREYITCLVGDSNSGLKTDLDCIKTRRGKYGGTWLHQSLALRFARWCSVSFEYQLDKWIGQRIDNEHQRKIARDAARTGYLPMTNAIEHAHDPAKPYHYSNEADLLNRLVLGMTAKQFKQQHCVDDVRDGCDMWQVQMLEKVQRINSGLIECGMPFDDRKEKLQQVIDRDGLPANCDQILRVAA